MPLQTSTTATTPEPPTPLSSTASTDLSATTWPRGPPPARLLALCPAAATSPSPTAQVPQNAPSAPQAGIWISLRIPVQPAVPLEWRSLPSTTRS